MSGRIVPQRRRPIVYILSILCFGLVAGPVAVHAQLPLPFGLDPDPDKRPQCTRDYRESVRQMGEAIEKLRTSGPEAIGRLCAIIETGSSWFGGQLPDAIRQELRTILGTDVDLQRLKEQCRVGQDAIARELEAYLLRLKAESVRCDDTI